MKSFKFGMILAMGLSTFVATGCDDDDDGTTGTDTEETGSGDTDTTGGETTEETTETTEDTTDTGTTEPEEISAGPIAVKAFTGGTGKGLSFDPSKIDSEEGPYSVADYTYSDTTKEITGAALAFATVGGKLYYWAGIDGITINGKEISKKDTQLGNEELVAEGEFEVIAGGYAHTLLVEDLTGTTANVTITLGDKQ